MYPFVSFVQSPCSLWLKFLPQRAQRNIHNFSVDGTVVSPSTSSGFQVAADVLSGGCAIKITWPHFDRQTIRSFPVRSTAPTARRSVATFLRNLKIAALCVALLLLATGQTMVMAFCGGTVCGNSANCIFVPVC